MNLSALIEKAEKTELATATVATVATIPVDNCPSVAKVASVAVANSPKPEIEVEGKAWKWRVTFPDGRTVFSHNVPFATREEVMQLYPDAEYVGMA